MLEFSLIKQNLYLKRNNYSLVCLNKWELKEMLDQKLNVKYVMQPRSYPVSVCDRICILLAQCTVSEKAGYKLCINVGL